jgi:hypothetical protein
MDDLFCNCNAWVHWGFGCDTPHAAGSGLCTRCINHVEKEL